MMADNLSLFSVFFFFQTPKQGFEVLDWRQDFIWMGKEIAQGVIL